MQNKQTDGFTIVELLVAITIFAILVPVLASFLSFLTVLNDRARDITVVNALVENKVEGLRSQGFVTLSDGNTEFTDELPQGIAKPRSASYDISTVSPGLKQIDVSVSYNDNGQTRNLDYTTYMGELGVAQY